MFSQAYSVGELKLEISGELVMSMWSVVSMCDINVACGVNV